MSQVIGIDVGGTNTNVVLIQDGNLIAATKNPTDHQNLLVGAASALERIFQSKSRQKEEQTELHLSTTLTTNAIIEGRGAPVAAIMVCGPGVTPADLKFPFPVYPVTGAIDHRGRETESLDRKEIRNVLHAIGRDGFAALAIIGKFSIRNPQHELELAELVQTEFPELTPVTLGHRLTGRLNFPRRVMTAVLNASVTRLQETFAGMVKELSGRHGIGERIFVLKADGGTMRLEESLLRPVETILSGPAASIMGALALGAREERTTAVTLDIGGTTTEIAVLVNGEPLTERDGAIIAGYRTLVPALFSRSIGLGGDSRISWSEGKLKIGPERDGPPFAMGGPRLTPTDAIIALGRASFGNRQKALAELEQMGQRAGLTSAAMAERIIAVFCEKAVVEIRNLLEGLNRIPVYTVSEVLASKIPRPEKIIGMGGPAEFFIPRIAAGMGLPYQVLPYAEAANAVGAAASRPTVAVNLRADTALGRLIVPELDEMVDLPRAIFFNLKNARELAREKTAAYAVKAGIDADQSEIEITEEEVFNIVRGFHAMGRLFSLKAQLKPGVNRIRIK